MALDPATRKNGCLQFIPGSHKGVIEQHVLYEDSIHAELLRERAQQMISTHGVCHVELDPGDLVCWHSSALHYSLPNSSDQGRIGVAGVYTTPDIIRRRRRGWTNYRWVLRNGEVVTTFPPQPYPDDGREAEPTPTFPRVVSTSIANT